MSNELYLILHKVRGEPAFDIASRLDIGSAGGWIVPTSGHRAYPYRWWNLDDLAEAIVPGLTTTRTRSQPITLAIVPQDDRPPR